MDNKDAHLIVLGNEKGGTGKSTLAMHIVVGLLDVGKKVAVIDLDSRQKSVARYLQNRQTFMVNGGAKVTMPEFIVVAQSEASLIKDREIEDQKNLQADRLPWQRHLFIPFSTRPCRYVSDAT